MEWSESINRYFPHMAGCPLPIYCTLPSAHCPFNVLCIVCVLHKIYQCPKYTLLVIQVFKGYCPLPIEYCQLPIASRQWLVSNCAQNPFSFTTAGVNFFLQVWLRFSSSCCWEGSQTAASTPTSPPGTSFKILIFFFTTTTPPTGTPCASTSRGSARVGSWSVSRICLQWEMCHVWSWVVQNQKRDFGRH